MALIRILFLAFLVLSVIYVSLSWYSRARRRDKLEHQWRADLRVGDRDAWVREGLQAYDRSLRRKLILGVYIVPMICVITLIYVQNFM